MDIDIEIGCGCIILALWCALKVVWWFLLAPLIIDAFYLTAQQGFVVKLLGVVFL